MRKITKKRAKSRKCQKISKKVEKSRKSRIISKKDEKSRKISKKIKNLEKLENSEQPGKVEKSYHWIIKDAPKIKVSFFFAVSF